MEHFLFYILKSSICLIALYIPFRIFIRKETLNYISRYIKYPTDALEKGIQGKVVLELHLTEHEHLNTVKVIEGVTPSLDAEAVRIIKETPIWKTSHKNTTKLLMPIIFTLM